MTYLDPRTDVVGTLSTTPHASPLFAGAENYAARMRLAAAQKRADVGVLPKAVASLFGELRRVWRRAETRRQLSLLSSHQLQDIGLLDADLDEVARSLATDGSGHKQ